VKPGALDVKLIRDLRAQAGVLLAIASIIAAGVACYVTMRSAYHSLGSARNRFYARCHMADFTINLKKAPLGALVALDRVEGIAEYQPRIQQSVMADLERSTEPTNGVVVSRPDRASPALINDIVVQSGSDFSPNRQEEVIVNHAFARAHGLRPGDRIHLLLNGRRQALEIVGTASSSEFVYLVSPGSLVPDARGFGVFYLKESFLSAVFDMEGACNQVVGRLDPAVRERPQRVLDEAERALDRYGVLATIPRKDQVSHRFLDSEIESLGVFAFFLPTIFLGVAALVLGVLMSRLADRQRTVLGTLKAIGYSGGKLLAHMMKFAAVTGAGGGVLGVGIGYVMAEALTSLYRGFFQLPELENRLPASVFASGMAMSIGFALLGTLRSGLAILRLEPAEAMRPKPPARGGRIVIERLGLIWSRLDMAWRMVLRGLLRNQRRTIVSVLATALATALLVTGLVATDAVRKLVDFQFQKVLLSDVDLALRETNGIRALLDSERLVGVDHAEPVLEVACTFRNGNHWKRGAVSGLAPGAILTVPRDEIGNPIEIPARGLLLGSTLAAKLHVRPGDRLVVEPTAGRRQPFLAPVAGLSTGFLGESAYADARYLSREVGEGLALSRIQLSVESGERTGRRLRSDLKRYPEITAFGERSQTVQNLQRTLIDTNQATIGLLIVFSGLIVFGTALNASLVTLEERRREVATLLVLGYEHNSVSGWFLRESLILTALGTLLGLPLGEQLFHLMMAVQQTDLFRIPEVSPWPAWGKACVATLACALLAHAFIHRSIWRSNWLEQLKGFE
jgi:putative ABC transport system permease protein